MHFDYFFLNGILSWDENFNQLHLITRFLQHFLKFIIKKRNSNRNRKFFMTTHITLKNTEIWNFAIFKENTFSSKTSWYFQDQPMQCREQNFCNHFQNYLGIDIWSNISINNEYTIHQTDRTLYRNRCCAIMS